MKPLFFYVSVRKLASAAETVISATEQEKQDDPQAFIATASTAVVGVGHNAISAAAAQQEENPQDGVASSLVTVTSTVCCS